MKLPDGVSVLPVSREVVLTQDEDSDGRTGYNDQYLTLSTTGAGGGPYLVIETERWAIDADSIDDFAQMLKDFLT